MAGFVLNGTLFPARAQEPGLYVVATPIGNLRDITLRALETLASVTLVACEDSRVSGKLLKHFGMSTKLVSYHEHNAQQAGERLLDAIRSGSSVALISDAGTPLVSDPGQRLVAAAREQGLPVWPIPGPSAPIAALSASGLSSTAFMFCGFLPTKEGARRTRLRQLRSVPATLVFFESPNRLDRALSDMVLELGPDREVAICREITKLHEEMVRGSAAELAADWAGKPVKGEIVLLVGPPQAETAMDPDSLLEDLMPRMSLSDAVAEATRLTGQPRKLVYARALHLSGAAKPEKDA